MIIKKFDEFETDDVLKIFDFDDTLVDSPSFDKLAIEHLKEGVTISSLLNKSLKMIDAKVEDLQIENGRIFIKDTKREIDVKGNWIRRKDRVYLFSPEKFYYTDLSLPKKVTKIAEIYNSSKNKAIVTGRVKSMEPKVRKSMKELGLEEPNFGLHCYPTKAQTGDKVAEWKGKTIIKIIKDSNIDNVVFYEDNRKWLNVVTKMIKESLPDIKFKGIKV